MQRLQNQLSKKKVLSVNMSKKYIPHDKQQLISPHFITHKSSFYTLFYHLFVSVECRTSAFDFKENNISQISFGEPIKNKIIDSFSQKHQILVRIRKIGQQRRYFFMYMSKNDITRPRHCIASLFFDGKHKIDLGDKISDNTSDNYSYDNKSKIRIHREKIRQ